MFKLKRIIPKADNQLYYSGLQSIFLGYVYSFFGVIVYAFFLKRIGLESLTSFPLIIVFMMISFCLLICFFSKTKKNYVFFRKSTAMYCPCLAKIFLVLNYVFTSAYCSLFFDSLTTASTKLELEAFAWSSLCQMLAFTFFGLFAVEKIIEEQK
ncbi:hypothetical protein PHDIMM138B_23020 [Phytobacter diazotrophicus]